ALGPVTPCLVRSSSVSFVLRLVIILTAVGLAACAAAYLFSRDRRYLKFAWQLFKFSGVFVLLLMAILLMGRVVLG
ncbi:MAG: hypothetical protein ACREUA_10510, partial [Burkholderiales bacterium]